MSHRGIKSLLLFCLWFLICINSQGKALSLRIVTEHFPPYNYQTSDHKLAGVMNQIVQVLITRLELQQRIEVLPWARAYKIALEEPDVLIYSILKTPARLHRFHWLSSFLSLDINIYALPETINRQKNQLNDVTQHSIGILRASAHENYIRKRFSSHERNVITNTSYRQLYQMHQMKRLDLLVAPRKLIKYLNKELQTPADKHPLAIFKLPSPYQKKLYIALSKGTSMQTVAKVKQALKAMQEDGTITEIINSY